MNFAFKLKYRFFNAFRELFVHHHGSLEFRAKVFALMIAANDNPPEESYILVKEMAMDIYNNDENRANLLMLNTKEIVEKVVTDNGLDIDKLVLHIQQELKIVPRYANKIDMKLLKPLVLLTKDEETIDYQERILEFLSKLKNEYTENN
ncbi:hypothetical protein [Sulfurimonas sp. C5]|uniref:hypothetical protein n=1 Tax=Sulfurimonas sp. C5 TaxID=3036947 RepID=UPI0024589F94|nr:hypothetical protein [Sulfurimonas sp. C5]MDH4943539.1 hypothetical protein [Sulfurimonas sp. C5]